MRLPRTKFNGNEDRDQYIADLHMNLSIACALMSGNAWSYDTYASKYNVVVVGHGKETSSYVDMWLSTRVYENGRETWKRGEKLEYIWVGSAAVNVRALLQRAAEIPQKEVAVG